MTVKENKDLGPLHVGIDISKDIFEICMMDADGKVVKTFQIGSDRNGFKQLIEKIPKNVAPIFVMESTGPHAGNLMNYLNRKGHKCVLSNPFEVSRLRDAFSHSLKNDFIDAFVLATASRMNVIKHSSKEYQYIYLQDILERYFDLVERKTGLQNQLQAGLVQTFPEITKVFNSIDCKASLAILGEYPSANIVADLEGKALKEIVRKSGGRIKQKQIDSLISLSKESVAWKQSKYHQQIIKSQVEELKIIKSQIDLMVNLMD